MTKKEIAQSKKKWFADGLAMFSMFFGAGNVIFPLMVGQQTSSMYVAAFLGLFLTAILLPFTGLIAMTLFEGNYEKFVGRIGKKPATFLILIMILAVGPLGGIPRAVALTYSSFHEFFPNLNMAAFTASFVLITYLLSVRQGKVLDILGYVLTPLLLLFIGIIVLTGVMSDASLSTSSISSITAFQKGLFEGYFTMDLIAAVFFSSVVSSNIRSKIGNKDHAGIMNYLFKSSLVGSICLGLVYLAFIYLAALYSTNLLQSPSDQYLGLIGKIVLGHHAGLIVPLIVALSCLTTAIALALVSAEFFRNKIGRSRITYEHSLFAILFVSWILSLVGFSTIIQALTPMLIIVYPALLVLSIMNILHKTLKINIVKLPFYFVLVLGLVYTLFN